jgi:hypothetical protein
MSRPARRYTAVALSLAVVALIVVPLAAAASHGSKPSSHVAKPKIKGSEAGYFGNALSTQTVSVIVYSNLGPSAGNRVSVCLRGNTCKKAVGHNAKLPWYRADFNTPTLTMSDSVTFTAYARDAAGRTTAKITKPVLCIKDDGSTPQT